MAARPITTATARSNFNRRFTAEELSTATLSPPFGWTKSAPVLKIPVTERSPMYSNYGPGALLLVLKPG
jgi:hypothetical protein